MFTYIFIGIVLIACAATIGYIYGSFKLVEYYEGTINNLEDQIEELYKRNFNINAQLYRANRLNGKLGEKIARLRRKNSQYHGLTSLRKTYEYYERKLIEVRAEYANASKPPADPTPMQTDETPSLARYVS